MQTPTLFDVVNRTLWQWLILGALAVVLVPAARGSTDLLGWLPFWLLLAPAVALLVLHRRLPRDSAPAALWAAIAFAPRRRASPRGAERHHSRTPSRLRSSRRRNSPMMRR